MSAATVAPPARFALDPLAVVFGKTLSHSDVKRVAGDEADGDAVMVSSVGSLEKTHPDGGGYTYLCGVETALLRCRPVMLNGVRSRAHAHRYRTDPTFKAAYDTGAMLARDAYGACRKASTRGLLWDRYCACRDQYGPDAVLGFFAQCEKVLQASGKTVW